VTGGTSERTPWVPEPSRTLAASTHGAASRSPLPSAAGAPGSRPGRARAGAPHPSQLPGNARIGKASRENAALPRAPFLARFTRLTEAAHRQPPARTQPCCGASSAQLGRRETRETRMTRGRDRRQLAAGCTPQPAQQPGWPQSCSRFPERRAEPRAGAGTGCWNTQRAAPGRGADRPSNARCLASSRECLWTTSASSFGTKRCFSASGITRSPPPLRAGCRTSPAQSYSCHKNSDRRFCLHYFHLLCTIEI